MSVMSDRESDAPVHVGQPSSQTDETERAPLTSSDGPRAVHAGDLADIRRWHRSHGLDMAADGKFPRNGMIVPGVAAGFLYSTDSSVCFIEGFVSNPEASVMERGRALRDIGAGLLLLAKRLGFSRAVSTTQSDGIAALGRRLGFRDDGLHHVLRHELEG